MKITNINKNYDEDDNLVISANIDGVLFTNIANEDTGVTLGGIVNRANSVWTNDSKSEILPAVNAVDIDWNGAVLKIA